MICPSWFKAVGPGASVDDRESTSFNISFPPPQFSFFAVYSVHAVNTQAHSEILKCEQNNKNI